MRRLGDIMFDVEDILTEMYEEHDMQLYEVVSLIIGWTAVHHPDAIEEYEDGSTFWKIK